MPLLDIFGIITTNIIVNCEHLHTKTGPTHCTSSCAQHCYCAQHLCGNQESVHWYHHIKIWNSFTQCAIIIEVIKGESGLCHHLEFMYKIEIGGVLWFGSKKQKKTPFHILEIRCGMHDTSIYHSFLKIISCRLEGKTSLLSGKHGKSRFPFIYMDNTFIQYYDNCTH